MTPQSSSPDTLTGRVVRLGDTDHPEASAGWNLLFTHAPQVIVYAQETVDVVNAITWARLHEVPLRVRSGGHCLEGWSNVDDGMVIDVSEMKSVSLDTDRQTATVGAGLNQLEAVTALGRAGFAAPTGTEGTVGLVGATLGGGFGLLTRIFGMASDNLLAAEIVVPSEDGGAEVIVADETHHADLLWALRGAGNGNFGVVTSLTFRVHPVAQTIYITATWQGLDLLPAVFEVWQRSAPATDSRLTSQIEISGDAVQVLGVLVSGSKAEALQLLAPIFAIGEPEITMTDASWVENYTAFQIPTADEPANWKFLSQFTSTPFPREAIDLICTFMSKAPTPQCNYFANAFGGEVVRTEPTGGSVFAHRNALFYAEPGAGWGVRGGPSSSDDPLGSTCLKWVADFHEALAPYVSGAYSNVPNADSANWRTDYWGTGLDRLDVIKARYDPHRVFSFEQGL
ncbi:FAD/FMN-containing dehydrogenase [Williamsia limnetica]|uniref:FAD/FMN-containing dehydrogenase n=1 Tax=Williamsia limnetica TaxID=882452 RepID=A0A318RLN3_WILLI|nr:FAD-binding oxidoreductase [Williamsia limnetica]PYE19232.1 FAD/FMN-containing dehydrogenase [Williamsia limnetica]